jgi:C_GCAxxG_C_C family probable redox protein
MNKSDLAKKYFKEGYNCCQAVVLAFASDMGLNETTALAIASSFGGGIGRLREVCGAVSGMCIVAGMMYGYTSPTDSTKKAEHYQLIQKMAAEFEEKNGSIICKVLTGIQKDHHIPTERTNEFYKKRPCVELVGDAAKILENVIAEKELTL